MDWLVVAGTNGVPDFRIAPFASGAYSLASFVRADGKRLRWAPSVYKANASCGLDTRTFALGNLSYAVLYGFAMYPDSTHLQLLENISGTPTEVGTATWTAGDVFELRVSTSGVVTYYKNNTLLVTSPRAIAAATPIWASGSLFTVTDIIDNVELIPL